MDLRRFFTTLIGMGVLTAGVISARPAEAATADITFFAATKVYNSFGIYMGDTLQYSVEAAWTTPNASAEINFVRVSGGSTTQYSDPIYGTTQGTASSPWNYNNVVGASPTTLPWEGYRAHLEVRTFNPYTIHAFENVYEDPA